MNETINAIGIPFALTIVPELMRNVKRNVYDFNKDSPTNRMIFKKGPHHDKVIDLPPSASSILLPP